MDSPDMSPVRGLARLLVPAAFVLGAVVSVLGILPGRHAATFVTAASDDALTRRHAIVRRILEEEVRPADIPTLRALFKGEWAFGTYTMAGYAVTNIALDAPETRPESLRVVQHILEQLQTPRLYGFDATKWGEPPLPVDGGADRGHIAFLGHFNLLLGAHRLLGGDDRYDTLHRDVTDAIARRMEQNSHHHVETYPGQTYTMDNAVAVASLAVADRVRGTNHRALIAAFLAYTRTHLLDPDTSLIVFGVDYASGAPQQAGRGCAAGWASFFLPFVDRQFAAEQFDALRTHLAGRIGPFAGVREHALSNPVAGYGDIDSGPVFGWGVSATGFAIAGARIHRDEELYVGLLRLAEVFGITVDHGEERRYLASPLLGDAILLAMKTARPWWEGMGAR